MSRPPALGSSYKLDTFQPNGAHGNNNSSEYYNETESDGSRIRNSQVDDDSDGEDSNQLSFKRNSGGDYGVPGNRGLELGLGDTGQSSNFGVMSCVLDSQGLKVERENFEIGQTGMKNIKTGEVIVGNLIEEDLELGEILGNGASGYVYAAVHKPTGRKVALKRINVFDKGKRHQLINDLRSLSKHECPFLITFYGAMFDEGSVKVALELMDIGSLKDVVTLSKKAPSWVEGCMKPCVPEPVCSKII